MIFRFFKKIVFPIGSTVPDSANATNTDASGTTETVLANVDSSG